MNVLLFGSFIIFNTKSYSASFPEESFASYFKLYFPTLLVSYSPLTLAFNSSLELSVTLTPFNKSILFPTYAVNSFLASIIGFVVSTTLILNL